MPFKIDDMPKFRHMQTNYTTGANQFNIPYDSICDDYIIVCNDWLVDRFKTKGGLRQQKVSCAWPHVYRAVFWPIYSYAWAKFSSSYLWSFTMKPVDSRKNACGPLNWALHLRSYQIVTNKLIFFVCIKVRHSISYFRGDLNEQKCRWSDNIYRQSIPNRNWVGEEGQYG